MAFDALTAHEIPTVAAEPASFFNRPVANPDAAWVASNPDRMLALLFVSPRDCEAIDALYAA